MTCSGSAWSGISASRNWSNWVVRSAFPSANRAGFDAYGSETCFLSSNAWDAHAAKANGFRVLWCNRFGQAPERIPERRDGEIGTVAVLPEIVGV